MEKKKKTILTILLVVMLLIGLLGCAVIAKKGITKVLGFLDYYSTLSSNVDYLSETLHDTMDALYRYEQLTGEMEALVPGARRHLEYKFDYTWAYSSSKLIAHAFGGVDDKVYTNSYEAFLHNYELGHRIFEVDFSLTQPENALVAVHDDEDWYAMVENNGVSSENLNLDYTTFMNTKLYSTYTPLDCSGVIDLLIQYPDIYIITDTKHTDKTSVYLQFSQLVRCAEQKDPLVLDRIIPQVYHEDMLDWVMEIYPFQSAILTLYQMMWTPELVYEICLDTNIRFVTLSYNRLTPEIVELWDSLGIIIACHTLDDPTQTQKLFDMGADFMYTDFLIPSQFE